MMNTIRADIYRVVRGKALYITFTLLIVLALIEVLPPGSGANVGVNTNIVNMNFSKVTVTGSVAAQLLLTVMDNLIYFLIPMFIAVVMAMFSSNAVKNSLSTGMSRVKLYFSKWILSSVLCVLLMLVYLLLGVLAAALVWGSGEWTGAYLLTILRAFGAQMVVLLALNSIGVFLSFAIRNTAAVIGVYIAFVLVPAVVGGILSNSIASIANYYSYDMTMCMKLFSYFESASRTDIARGLTLAGCYIIVSTVAGITLFKRAEIK